MDNVQYLVEVVYDKVVTTGQGTPDFHQYTELDVHLMHFTGDNKSHAKQEANRYFDRVLRYGLTLSGGGVLKSVIPPHNIKNIGLVDYPLYMEERAKLAEEKLEAVQE